MILISGIKIIRFKAIFKINGLTTIKMTKNLTM